MAKYATGTTSAATTLTELIGWSIRETGGTNAINVNIRKTDGAGAIIASIHVAAGLSDHEGLGEQVEAVGDLTSSAGSAVLYVEVTGTGAAQWTIYGR